MGVVSKVLVKRREGIMYHINNNNESRKCHAKNPQSCSFYRGEDDSRHYENASDAAEASRVLLEDEHGKFSALKKNKYSFIENFQRLEEDFNEAWRGVPNRFANYDIRGKLLGEQVSIDEFADVDTSASDLILVWHRYVDKLGRLKSIEKIMGDVFQPHVFKYRSLDSLKELALKNFKDQGVHMDSHGLYDRVLLSMSAPADLQAGVEELREAARSLGVEDFEEVTGRDRVSYKSENFRGTVDGEVVYFTREAKHKDFNRYRSRLVNSGSASFAIVNTRSLMGAARLKNMTGVENFKEYVKDVNKGGTDEIVGLKVKTLNTLAKVERSQRSMQNFKAQKKYFTDQERGSSARVWEDKKHVDDLHKDLAKNNKMKDSFSHLEIDNDVKPEEFADFQKAFLEVRDKLPLIPGEKKPELRIRYLGRHKATGIYFPVKNTVAVDVRDSSSFIHEMGHYYDIAVQGNASLRGEFAEVVHSYGQKLDDSQAGGKGDYYRTPTEVFARAFEKYAHEKLGINNRLLNTGNLSRRFDYAPFNDDDVKNRAFRMFDKLFNVK